MEQEPDLVPGLDPAPARVDIDLDAIRERRKRYEATPYPNWQPTAFVQAVTDTANDVPALLARLAEVEAERDQHEPVYVGCPTCRTILRPRAVPGGCADPWHAENAIKTGTDSPAVQVSPALVEFADPPGLDAAIEAVVEAARRTKEADSHEDYVRTIVRAAAPALRAGALREAADALRLRFGGNVTRFEDWLRERADRIGGAT